MIYTADTETIKNPDGSMRVWLADVCCVDDLKHKTFLDLDGLFEWAFSQRERPTLLFHNLKFDGSYILNWAHAHGYTYAEKCNAPGTYSVLVTDRSVWFVGSIMSFDGKRVDFNDSLKKIPLSVAQIAEAYKLPILKGGLDYKMYRAPGYQPTAAEIAYIHNDTEIVARALQIHFAEGMTKLTAPSDALAQYKLTVDFESKFVSRFWASHPGVERFCRRAYCGGISWVNPDIKEIEVRHGLVYDYNSMYPSVMLKYPYPVGYPVRWYSKPPTGYNLWIGRANVHIFRQADKPACIRNPIGHTWIDTEFEGEIYLTSVDCELLQTCYYGEVDILDGYAWRGETGIFTDYINHWSEIKRTSTGAMRQLAKLMLNSLYGKFGTNPDKYHKAPEFDEDGILHFGKPIAGDKRICYNVAVAAFVTAYARRELITGALSCRGVLCYMDTDSLHIASTRTQAARFDGVVHPTDFCAWKMENRFVRARYLRQKTYIEEKADGRLLIAACGCPAGSRKYITYENFAIGASYKGKLRPVMRRGGVDLEETRFTIRAPICWKI